MTLLKIALTVLGTAGLTAGTVLAVAEPSPSPLPACAAQAVSCSACPKAGCGTAKCTSASACPAKAAANACAAADGGCSSEACNRDGQAHAATDDAAESGTDHGVVAKCRDALQISIDGPEASPRECVVGITAESACTKSACDGGSCGKFSVGTVVDSAAGVVGRIIASESNCDSTGKACGGDRHCGSGFVGIGSALSACCDAAAGCCEAGSCIAAGSCAEGECGREKHCLTLSFGITSGGPTFQLTSGAKPAASGGACPSACAASACGHGDRPSTACGESCGETHRVSATACEAKPACAAAACPASTCESTACDGSACAAGACAASKCESCPSKCQTAVEVFVDVVAPKPSACSVAACDCADCCCEACDCETDTACPPGAICPVAARIKELHAAGAKWHLTGGCAAPHASDAADPAVTRNYDSYRSPGLASVQTPGWVRLTHFPDLDYVPPVSDFWSQISPTPWAQPIMAAGGGFESMASWPRLVTASFAAPEPIAAPRPSKEDRSIDGTWTRDVGPYTVTLTCEGGRMTCSCRFGEPGKAAEIGFSGACGVAPDGQVFGVIDEANVAAGDDHASVMTHQALAVRMVDQPFAIRFRRDGESLIVIDVRCGGLLPQIDETNRQPGEILEQVRVLGCGRFTRSE